MGTGTNREKTELAYRYRCAISSVAMHALFLPSSLYIKLFFQCSPFGFYWISNFSSIICSSCVSFEKAVNQQHIKFYFNVLKMGWAALTNTRKVSCQSAIFITQQAEKSCRRIFLRLYLLTLIFVYTIAYNIQTHF